MKTGKPAIKLAFFVRIPHQYFCVGVLNKGQKWGKSPCYGLYCVYIRAYRHECTHKYSYRQQGETRLTKFFLKI